MSLKDSIRQIKKRENITQDEFFRRLGYSYSSLMETASAKAQVAFQLAFGNGPTVSRKKDKELEKLLPWVRKFPIRALQKMGHIPANVKGADLVCSVFKFMQVGSIAGFENYYGTTLQSANPQTYAAWIRLGELQSRRSNAEFTPDREAIISCLKFLRTNAFHHYQGIRRIAQEALLDCGIEVIEIEPFLTAPIPTCAFYWRGSRPVVQFPTTKMDDSKFLEALFHAVAHVLYHPLRTSCLLLGNQAQVPALNSATAKNAREIEAHRFAQDMLLSEAEECELICCGRFNETRCIQHFSGLFHVRPGILVERLQQQGKISRRTLLNDFKIAV